VIEYGMINRIYHINRVIISMNPTHKITNYSYRSTRNDNEKV